MTEAVESEWNTADGLHLHVRTWNPSGDPLGVVVLVHGLGEHAGRYDHVARAFRELGLRVVGADHRGHGRSGGLRGHVDGFSQFVGDLAGVIADAREGLQDKPWFLFAHSMGGLVALRYLQTRAQQPTAAVISNPLLKVAVEAPKIKIIAGKLLSRVLPTVRMDNEVDANLISRDADEVAKYIADPLVHSKITPRWFTSMTRAKDAAHADSGRIGIPLAFVLSGQDKICHPEGTRRFVEALGEGGARLFEYPDAFHEAHNGPDRERVLADVSGFLREHLAS